MKKWMRVLLVLAAMLSGLHAGTEEPLAKESEDFTNKVIWLKVGEKSLMNKHSFKYWRNVLKQAEAQGATAVIFDIDTPGGYAAETADLITRVMPELTIRSIAFVNPEATSAGSMIAFGCDKIYMHPRGTIGSTGIVNGTGAEIEPVMRAKIESLFQSYVKIVAKERGRNPDVMKAMMFRDQEFSFADGKVTVSDKELLNLIADEAIMVHDGKPLLADGICEDIDAVLVAEGLDKTTLVSAEPRGFQAFAQWVGLVSPILISVGALALFMEFKTPGFGVFGVIAMLAFGLFFVGNNMDGNLATGWLFVLFMAGVVLLILEFFVIPGTFIAGAVGVLMILASLMLAMVDMDVYESFKDKEGGVFGLKAVFGFPLIYVSVGLTCSLVLSAILMRFVPSVPMYDRLTSRANLEAGTGVEHPFSELVGKVAITKTPLAPSGKVSIEHGQYDAVARSGYVEAGVEVEVVEADGMRIVVDVV
ncbi:NfeD family protein [Rubritalea marina]|uniref:NfeD family protein n=1 Tax=Rubritalea marina TaxID=361055 RepID=UPI000376780E|nr:NfeD family protein [Rubritalea marina]